MFALTVLLILAVYVLISLGAIWTARAAARRRGRRPWVWGWVAAIAMYHLVFWDLIPTAILYPLYQANEAGVWVYKTPEQWLAENRGVEETLTRKEISDVAVIKNPYVRTVHLNQRLKWVERQSTRWPQITEIEHTVVDISNREVLVRAIYLQSGECRQPQHYRVWIKRCGESTLKIEGKFFRSIAKFHNIGVLQ